MKEDMKRRSLEHPQIGRVGKQVQQHCPAEGGLMKGAKLEIRRLWDESRLNFATMGKGKTFKGREKHEVKVGRTLKSGQHLCQNHSQGYNTVVPLAI